MKERPILFSTPMVQALLDNRKFQTRRIVKPQPTWKQDILSRGLGDPCPGVLAYQEAPGVWHHYGSNNFCEEFCPYGAPGEWLWCRETFFAWGYWTKHYSGEKERDVWYFNDKTIEDGKAYRYFDVAPAAKELNKRCTQNYGWYKRPAIFMPRVASRLLLEITDVRVQRLQDISEEDAIAEGVESIEFERDEHDMKICPRCGGTRLYTSFSGNGGAMFDTDCTKCDTHVKRYKWLWESINGEGSWNSNPWIFAITFRKVSE